MQKRHTRRAGFTLTETAIILGVVSLVLAGIWTAASSVWRNYQNGKASDQIATVAQNIRDYYTPLGFLRNATGGAACTGTAAVEITSLMDSASRRILPTDMVTAIDVYNGPVNHALATTSSGTFKVYCLNAGRSFRLSLTDLKQEACVGLALALPLLDPQMGIEKLTINSTASDIDPTNIEDPGATIDLPLTITGAQSLCSKTDGQNKIMIDYTL